MEFELVKSEPISITEPNNWSYLTKRVLCHAGRVLQLRLYGVRSYALNLAAIASRVPNHSLSKSLK